MVVVVSSAMLAALTSMVVAELESGRADGEGVDGAGGDEDLVDLDGLEAGEVTVTL